MLNLALVALLSGSLLTGSPDGDCEKGKTDCETAPAAQAETALPTPPDERSLTSDTYAYGRPSDAAPIKLWVEAGIGNVEEVYLPNGDEVELNLNGVAGDIQSQRVAVGAQINVINFPAFKLGFGGHLNIASNKFENANLESGFGLQNVKIFATARGRVVGIHGGYILDLADEEQNNIAAGNFPTTEGRDAIFFGADFDYPSENFRLFGGADYYLMQEGDVMVFNPATGGLVTVNQTADSDILAFVMGAGLRFGILELGAALHIQTQFVDGFVSRNNAGLAASGGHNGSIAPYLKLSPPSLPVSLFVRGAVRNAFTEYGFRLGGGNDIKSNLGFTAGLTVGFD
ncbi:MAG: hypothetical protein HKN04_11735 [Rhodothermaceae bacterium]|nr:hypothetical protein [Rhodothermaceae bacterium]